MTQIGRFSIHSVINGWLGLDGGAMFGVVPRALWSRKIKPDEANRIRLAMRTLVAIDADAGTVVLVDTGAGSKWPADEAERFCVQPNPTALADLLRRYHLSEADVTDIVVTHLHFDHNGGLSEWVDQEGGAVQLRFPQARHWIHRRHWEHAHKPNLRDQASFLERDLTVLAESDALSFVEGDEPESTIPGVRWRVSHGHTPYQLLPEFGGQEDRLLFIGDMIPTAMHLPLPWIMAYDLEPLRTLAEKQGILARCQAERLWLAFPHDPECAGVALEVVNQKPIIAQTLDLA